MRKSSFFLIKLQPSVCTVAQNRCANAYINGIFPPHSQRQKAASVMLLADVRVTRVRNIQYPFPCKALPKGYGNRNGYGERRGVCPSDTQSYICFCDKELPKHGRHPFPTVFQTCPLTRQKLPFGYPKGQVLIKKSHKNVGLLILIFIFAPISMLNPKDIINYTKIL